MLTLMIHFIEPIGYKAPSFATDSKISSFDRETNSMVTLLCPAQAYPYPSYRYIYGATSAS